MKLVKEGYLARPIEFSHDTKVYVFDIIHKDLKIETTNGEILAAVAMFQAELKKNGKQYAIAHFRLISRAIRDTDVDSLYQKVKASDDEALKTWRDLCCDVVMLAAFRLVIWKKPIPMSLTAAGHQEIF